MNNFLLTSLEKNILTITLNRPELHNAFNRDFIKTLTAQFRKTDTDKNVRAVILNANGKSFCAGADLNWLKESVNYTAEENLEDATELATLMQTLNNLNKPVIALVQGSAYGGGVGLLACCDIVLATKEAQFCFSEVKLGIIPAVISPYVINAIGPRAARRYFLTAEKFGSDTAHQLGLIHEIVTTQDLQQRGQHLAQTLALNGANAISAAKQLIHDVAHHAIDTHLIQQTIRKIAEIRISSEAQEGLRAFLEKRKPSWQ